MTCGFCDRTDSITTVNGVNACVDHLDNAFKPVGQQVAAVRRLAEGVAAPG